MQKPTYNDLNTWLEHAIQERDHLSVKVETLQDDLEKTRKALDVAVDMLKLVYQGNGDPQDIMRYKDNRWTAVRRLCKQSLDEITALEQKESAFVHNKIEFPEYNDGLLEEFDKQFFENGQDDI